MACKDQLKTAEKREEAEAKQVWEEMRKLLEERQQEERLGDRSKPALGTAGDRMVYNCLHNHFMEEGLVV